MEKPRYLQIADELIARIKSGKLPTGSILPTENILQQEFGVSRVTVRNAMKVLQSHDLLNRVRGSGTYVKSPKAQHNAFQLTGFLEEIRAQGKTPSSQILSFSMINSDELIAEKLNLNIGEQIYSICRLRLIDNEPEVLEQTYMPVSLFPDLSIQFMQQSKYEYIEKHKKMTIKLSRQNIQPELLNAALASKLNVAENYPVIRVDSVGELEDGQPFEYSIHYFRLNQFSFNFVAYRTAN